MCEVNWSFTGLFQFDVYDFLVSVFYRVFSKISLNEKTRRQEILCSLLPFYFRKGERSGKDTHDGGVCEDVYACLSYVLR